MSYFRVQPDTLPKRTQTKARLCWYRTDDALRFCLSGFKMNPVAFPSVSTGMYRTSSTRCSGCFGCQLCYWDTWIWDWQAWCVPSPFLRAWSKSDRKNYCLVMFEARPANCFASSSLSVETLPRTLPPERLYRQ